MAKNNNLTDFLTGVADAIRTKKGTTELINPQNFESEILSIETGGGGTSAVLGELNVSSNGTYEAGGKMTLIPGGIYQFKEQLPVETLAELYTAAQGNNGVIFSVLYQEIPLTQLVIHKTGDVYILESSSLAGMVENIYSTGTTTFTYTSIMNGGDITVELTSGWNTYIQNTKCEPPAQSTIRLPQDISGIPSNIINLVDLQFDTNNCVEAVLDASTTITTQKFGQFFKVTSNLNPAKRLTMVSMGGYDEFNIPEGEIGLEIGGMPAAFRNAAVSSELQTDIEGIKYLKNYMRNVVMMYVEDASKIQITSGTAENGCWYLNQYMVMDPNVSWTFAYDKDPVDGYNKVTVNVHSQAKLQSKTATSNGVYSPDEGFDGLSQVEVNVAPKLQTKTITENGTYTANTGYDGLSQVTVNVATTKVDSKTLLNNGKLAVHTVAGADDLSLDTNKATIEELIVNDGVTSVSKGTGYTNLKRVVLPDTLETIAPSTFSKCANLESMVIPFVGKYAGTTESDIPQCQFGYIFGKSAYTGGTLVSQSYYNSNTNKTITNKYYIPSSLKSVTVTGGNILYGAFMNCSMLTSITIPNSTTSIEGRVFSGCSSLTSITIPDNVTSIGDHSFEDCSGLTSITIPNSVTSIGYSTFYDCTGLTDITIGNSLTDIDSYAFAHCTGLTSIIIPDSVISIKDSAFSGCSNLASITIGNNMKRIGESAFYNTAYYNNESNWQDNVLYIEKYLIKAKTTLPRNYEIKSGTLTIADKAFYNCTELTSVIIPNSVTSIGASAFSGSHLASIDIPNSVTNIGSNAFNSCRMLRSANIPDSITSIEYGMFHTCDNLTSITIPNSVTSIGENAFNRCSGLTSITIPNSVTSIGSKAFEDCTGLTSITIPDNVTSIGNYVFNKCSKLTSVTIGNGIKSIGEYAFADCSGLTSVTIPGSVISIEEGAFNNCTNLINATIGNGIKSIGAAVFDNCSNLTSITIPDSVTSIGNSAFYNCIGLTNVAIGSGVTSIGTSVFYKCSGLTSVIIPDGVTSIGTDIFGYCTSLTNVTIGNGITSIPISAFKYCDKLTNINIPDNVTSIGGYAFQYCSGLTSITIPNSVTSIGENAFQYCTGLTSVTIENGVASIENGAFYGCSGLTSVTIPDSVTSIGENAFLECILDSVSVNQGNMIYHSQGNCLIETTSKKLILGTNNSIIPNDGSVTSIGSYAFYKYNALTSITIPDSVTNIGQKVFFGCSGLTSITIPNSVTSIGNYAFYECSNLTSITIPGNVTSIGENVFANCSGLTSVNIPNSVTSIGNSAFYGCSNLTSITIPDSLRSIGNSAFYGCSNLTSITLPDSVTSIGNSAFYECSGITSFTIPSSVTKIGEKAFYGCSSLTNLTIPASVKTIYAYTLKIGSADNPATIKILSETPPTIWPTSIDTSTLKQIIVPKGCGEKYKAVSSWSRYADYIIEEGMHRVTLGENVTCSVGGTSYSNQIFDVADQTVIHFEVGQASEVVSATPDGIFLNGVLVSDNSGPATYDLTVTGNVSVTYSTGDVVGDITYNNCYKIVMN